MLCLKTLSVKVRAGRATRTHKLVKSAGPDDLVFQSVQTGSPMNNQNILKRHIQSAAKKLGLPFVNWRCLRTSHAPWLVQAGADPKSVHGQMRHSRISTTNGYLRSDRTRCATPGARTASRCLPMPVQKTHGPIHGPIKRVFQRSDAAEKVGK
jgi:site-specific recombinase XerC